MEWIQGDFNLKQQQNRNAFIGIDKPNEIIIHMVNIAVNLLGYHIHWHA